MKSKRPQQKTRREKKRFKKKTFIIFFSSFIIIASFLYAMNHQYFRIENIEITGQKTIIEDDIKQSLQNYLNHKILGIIPRDNIVFINSTGIENYLRKEFTKIKNLEVSVKNGDRIVVYIGERSAHSLWCINKVYESVFDEECYFSDQYGLLYARAPYFSGDIYRKIFINPLYVSNENQESEEINYIGTEISVFESFSDFFDFLDILEQDFSLDTEMIYFNSFDDVSIEIARMNNIVYGQVKPVIIYNQVTDYDTIIRDIGIVFGFDSFKKDFKEKSHQLESIDVRFKNRAFYTFTPETRESDI